tara:strand:- start:190 stop:396 length:207 start_codon:yes stop_codon:yes gene_type:complete
MKLVYVILLILSFSSCSKHVAEETFVFDYQDISIPDVDSVYSVSFPTITIGFAVTNIGLYKTIDKGKT